MQSLHLVGGPFNPKKEDVAYVLVLHGRNGDNGPGTILNLAGRTLPLHRKTGEMSGQKGRTTTITDILRAKSSLNHMATTRHQVTTTPLSLMTRGRMYGSILGHGGNEHEYAVDDATC